MGVVVGVRECGIQVVCYTLYCTVQSNTTTIPEDRENVHSRPCLCMCVSENVYIYIYILIFTYIYIYILYI